MHQLSEQKLNRIVLNYFPKILVLYVNRLLKFTLSCSSIGSHQNNDIFNLFVVDVGVFTIQFFKKRLTFATKMAPTMVVNRLY